ncbi:MAG TPA: RNA polymerase sigma factor, partial [Acidimicrobiales bacterium]
PRGFGPAVVASQRGCSSVAETEGTTHVALHGESPPGTVLHVDDAELLESLLGGNESAFTELVRRYHPTLVKVARYYVANAASAEDVAQDTWIAVIKGAETFEGRSAFKTWLLRICANRARTTGVKEHRSIPVDPNESGPSVSAHRFDQGGFWSDPPVPFTDAIDARLDNSVLLGAVRDAIDALGEPQQAVVTLRDVEGLSTQEVATLLGLSEANVRVILHRGRARVREIVEEAMKGSKI